MQVQYKTGHTKSQQKSRLQAPRKGSGWAATKRASKINVHQKASCFTKQKRDMMNSTYAKQAHTYSLACAEEG